MEDRRSYNFNIPGSNNNNPLWSVLIGVFALVALYFIARFIFRILYFLAPLFLIAALILDYKVVVNYGKWLVKLFKQNLIVGIGASLLTVFGFPLVSAYLAGRAFFNYRIKQVEKIHQQETDGEIVDFEELNSEPLTLPELEKEKSKNEDYNEYEDLL